MYNNNNNNNNNNNIRLTLFHSIFLLLIVSLHTSEHSTSPSTSSAHNQSCDVPGYLRDTLPEPAVGADPGQGFR